MKQLPNDQILAKVQQALRDEASALVYLADFLNQDALAGVVNLFAGHQGHVYTTGCGTSGVTAKKIAHTMSCIEIPTVFLPPSDAIHGALGRVREGDIVIFVTKGGQSAELGPIMEACRTKKAICVVTTENPQGSMAKAADHIVPMNINFEADPFQMLATSSTLAAMGVWDAIIIVLLEMREYSKDRFKVIHTGGAVGVRLAAEEK